MHQRQKHGFGWSMAFALLPVLIAFFETGVLSAQPTTNVAPDAPVSRRYEVEDIVFAMGMRDFDNLARGAGAASSQGKGTDIDAAEKTSELIETIRQAVPDEAWTSAIDTDDPKAVAITVTSSPSAQAKIETAINHIRAETTLQVSVEARIFEFDPTDAKKLSFALPVDAEPTKALFVSDAQMKELIRIVQSDQQTASITAPRMTLFNNQSGKIAVSTQQAYVADITFAVGRDGQVAAIPVIKTVPSDSVGFDVRPAVSQDHLTTTLDMHVKYSRLMRLEKQQDYKGYKGATIQIPREFFADISDNVSVKDGQAALFVGGMNKYANRVCVIVIKPTVIGKDSKPAK